MKTVILAGGLGTRLSEETGTIPKPMVEIGGKPILWHILNIYGCQGFGEFVIALGYKGEEIKRYFLRYSEMVNDLTVDLGSGQHTIHEANHPDWKISLVDTGTNSNTGGRLKRLEKWVDSQTFMMTYGDGVADIDLKKLTEFHKAHGKFATVTAVRPPSRFGGLVLDGDEVREFNEKPLIGEGWINGGYFVLEPEAISYITKGDEESWERRPLEKLADDGQLMAFKHDGFWLPMDTLREKNALDEMWRNNKAPWKIF